MSSRNTVNSIYCSHSGCYIVVFHLRPKIICVFQYEVGHIIFVLCFLPLHNIFFQKFFGLKLDQKILRALPANVEPQPVTLSVPSGVTQNPHIIVGLTIDPTCIYGMCGV